MTPAITAINVDAHPLTRGMTVELHVAALRAPPPVKVEGAWSLPLGPRPTIEIARPAMHRYGILNRIVLDVPLGSRQQCANYYPVGGGVGWHTDHEYPGWRVYVHHIRRPYEGICQTRYNDHVFVEAKAFGAYVFRTGPGCWHAVECYTERFVCGMEIPDTLARSLIAAV